LGLAAAAVTLSVAAGPAVAQTNPFQPKGSATTATTAAATSGGSQSAASGSGATSSSGSSTGSSGSAAIVSPSASSSPAMPTTGVEAAHSALVGLACVALGLVLLVAARPRRSPRSGLHLASARTR
jgi:hypothetical protein